MTEAKFSKWLTKSLRDHKVDVQRIESTVDQGIPDINCCFGGFDFWIETKSVKANKVNLRPAQKAWHLRRSKHLGTVLIITWHQNTEEASIAFLEEDGKSIKEVVREPKNIFLNQLLNFITFMSTHGKTQY